MSKEVYEQITGNLKGTIANRSNKTMQEFFDEGVKHLFTQGRRSTSSSGPYCRYLGDTGLKCIVGYFIPESIYKKEYEGYSYNQLIRQFPYLSEFIRPSDDIYNDFMRDFQTIHDNPSNWKDTLIMSNSLKTFGEKYGLNTDVLRTMSFGDR